MRHFFMIFFLFPIISYCQFSPKRVLGFEEVIGVGDFESADMDNDGDIDMVGAAGGNTKIYINDGTNNFIIEKEFNYGGSFFLYDINNDYNIDIIIESGNDLILLSNCGNLEFNEELLFSDISADQIIGIDIENDNDLDIVIGESYKIQVYSNNGDGSFSYIDTLMLPYYYYPQIKTGDLNGDNYIDLIICSIDESKIEWYPNDQSGGFESRITICDLDSISDFGLSDFDNDNDIDLIISFTKAIPLKIYFNDGNGEFTENIVDNTNIIYPYKMAVSDYNGDGNDDLVISDWLNYDNIGLYCCLGIGDGTFNTKFPIDLRTSYVSKLFSLELTGDNYSELIAGHEWTDGWLGWYENYQDNNFSKRKLLLSSAGLPYQITTGDLDGDKDIDLVSSDFYTGIVCCYRNLGFGKFSSQEFVAYVGHGLVMSDIGDVDNDGDKDIVSFLNSGGKVVLQKNLGGGLFDTTLYIVDTVQGNYSGKFCDMDGDGDLDIFHVVDYGNLIKWIENDGMGNFATNHIISDSVTVYPHQSSNIGDLDNDGDIDVAVGYDGYYLFYNNGMGDFSSVHLDSYSYYNNESIDFADIDNDGDIDIFGGGDCAEWVENIGGGNYAPAVGIPCQYRVDYISAGDVDGDGWVDLVSATYFSGDGGDSIYWNKNLGNGTFSEVLPISHDFLYKITSLIVEDFDLDGDPDIAASIEDTKEFIWYENGFNSRFKIIGSVFYDENQNGIKDNEDTFNLEIPVELIPGYITSFVNEDGSYLLAVDTGSYTVSFINNPLWSLTTPYPEFNIDVNLTNPCVDTCHFGFYPDSIANSININLASDPQRCGEVINYWISILNTGTTIPTGIIEMEFHPLISYIDCPIIPDSVIGNKVYWSFDSLLYFNNISFNVFVLMPNEAFIGEVLTSYLNVFILDSIGEVEDSFSDTLSELLICSFDPNDKIGYPFTGEDEVFIQKNQRLEYTIRFQNTGSAEAVNVMVRDQLNNYLDPSTIEITGSSFPTQVNLEIGNELVFRFDSIMLIDSGTDELNSHGYVSFSILPYENLVPNTILQNTAEIYFDFNSPIITNTTTHIIDCWIEPETPVISVQSGVLSIDNPGNTFYWHCNGEIIYGELDTFLIPEQPGYYSVEVINQYGCSVFSDTYDYLTNIEIQNNDFKVNIFPNPFANKTNILLSDFGDNEYKIEIVNITGTTIKIIDGIRQNKLEIDLSELNPGIYFGKAISSTGKTGNFKLVKN